MKSLFGSLALFSLLLGASSVRAANPQANLNDFAPSVHPWDLSNVLTTRIAPTLNISGGFWFTYRKDAWKVETPQGTNQALSDQLVADFYAAVPFADLVSVGVGIPVYLVSKGDAPNAFMAAFTRASGASFGDLRLSAKVKFWKNKNRGIGLGAAQEFTFPTATGAKYTGEKTLTSKTSLLFDYGKNGFIIAANLSYLIRKDDTTINPNIGDEIHLGVGGQIPLICDRLDLLLSIYMRTPAASPFASAKKVGTMLMLGLKARIWKGLFASLSGGGGLGHMYGLPSAQVTLNFGWEPKAYFCDQDRDGLKDSQDRCPRVPGPRSAGGCPDRDHDGIGDATDKCPDQKGPASTGGCPDRDKDGILDKEDRCPDKAGPRKFRGCPDTDGDGLPDIDDRCPRVKGLLKFHGCPDTDGDGLQDSEDDCPRAAGPIATRGCPDRDKDGITDKKDRCPDQAGLAKFQGCPDGDGDGIEDAKDACPKMAGPESTRGCPDRDKDGVADKDDKCPDVWGRPEHQGCPPPTPIKIKVTRKNIVILKKVHFDPDSAKIKKKSHAILNDVATVLKENNWIKKVQVEGHTDDRSNLKYNMWLSNQRALSVVKFLVKRGIAASRLKAVGLGPTVPLLRARNKKAWAKNRRVEFKILEPR